jgi:hypothetical protein
MATYKQIQAYVKDKYGYFPKSCWIAHVKELSGLHPKASPNRHSISNRTNPCPVEKQADLKDALCHFNML